MPSEYALCGRGNSPKWQSQVIQSKLLGRGIPVVAVGMELNNLTPATLGLSWMTSPLISL